MSCSHLPRPYQDIGSCCLISLVEPVCNNGCEHVIYIYIYLCGGVRGSFGWKRSFHSAVALELSFMPWTVCFVGSNLNVFECE